jgi:dTDP-4-amino-4,6-dideoxy-D-galactose acyltransferase
VLEWDSNFWGFPIARVVEGTLNAERVPEIDAWCAAQGIRCLYLLAGPNDPQTTRQAEDAGYRCVDIRLTLKYAGAGGAQNGSSPAPQAISVRESRSSDELPLRAIARQIHRDTRFYFDCNFPRSQCDQLYDTWIQRSFEGFADVVLVADAGNEPVGYITCSADPHTHTGSIGLLGVSPHAQGRGAGRTLIRKALEWFAARELKEIHVVTQGRNIDAQRLYQRAGFHTRDLQLWYHKWYPAPRGAHR